MNWDESFENGELSSVILPFRWNPFAVRRIHDLFHCERCGKCCHYNRVPVTQVDVDRAPEIAPYVEREGDKGYLITKGGCPFLTDEGCSIYERRPDVCWLYPLQTPITFEGQERLVIRVRCKAALSVVKRVYELEKPRVLEARQQDSSSTGAWSITQREGSLREK